MNTRLYTWSTLLITLSLLAPGAVQPTRAQSQAQSAPARDRAEAVAGLQSAPLLFVENVGQFDRAVRFQLRAAGGTWWFTDEAVWLTVFEGPEPGAQEPQDGRNTLSSPVTRHSLPLKGVHLRFTFSGMSAEARLAPVDPRPTKMNYFMGSDAARWLSNVPTFGGLRWEGVYPGLDLVFGGPPSAAPLRSAPGTIAGGLGVAVEVSDHRGSLIQGLRLRVQGAQALRMDEHKRLIADTIPGPVALPLLRTNDGLSLVPALDADTITFAMPEPSSLPSSFHSLSAFGPAAQVPNDDPDDLLYSTFLGGRDNDNLGEVGFGIAVDRAGSAYVTGYTYSTDFPTTSGAFDTSYNGGGDAYVSKLNPEGTALEYSTYLGGSNSDEGSGIAVDGAGSAYVAGETSSADFPTTPGAFDTTCSSDAFVVKLNPEGSALEYSTCLGGSGGDSGGAIAVGGAGSAYVTGSTHSTDFPTTPGAFDRTKNGSSGVTDAFVTKLNPSGNALNYSTYLGGADYQDTGYSIAVDGAGGAYVTGFTSSRDFPTTPGAFDTICGTDGTCNEVYPDAFVAKLNSVGSALEYSTFLGASREDCYSRCAIAVDRSGSAYVAGATYSSDFPTTPGAFDSSYDFSDAYVVKLNSEGSALEYSTFLGGEFPDCSSGCAIAVDGGGNAHVTGNTASRGFPTTPGAFDNSFSGHSDVFVSKLNPQGTKLKYSTFLGGRDSDYGFGIAVDGAGSAYVTGHTFATDFPTTPGAFDTSFDGRQNAFVSKLNLVEP